MNVFSQIIHLSLRLIQSVRDRLETWFKSVTRPNNDKLLVGTALDLTRSKRELIAENALLRQQLIVLKRQIKRAQLTQRDRLLLVLLARLVQRWKEALLIVQPDTLVKWQRQGFRLFWRLKSRARTRQPRISEEAIALIQTMALENRRWGAKRIRDELKKLGYQVSKRTVAKYMRQARKNLPPRSSGQTWATFIHNHAHEMWACDFLQSFDVFFGTIFLFFIIELGSRRVVHFGVTRHPSDAWVAQQLREATPYGQKPQFLIRDNDDRYGERFTRVAAGRTIEVRRTPVRAPKANAVCERFLGSVRRECLDHMIILSERQLYQIINEYVTYFNRARPHQGIGSCIPDPPADDHTGEPGTGQVVAYPVLGGLHHDYRRAA